MILGCKEDWDRLLSSTHGVIAWQMGSSNYCIERKRGVGLRRRPVWRWEGWREPGEVSSGDYILIDWKDRRKASL